MPDARMNRLSSLWLGLRTSLWFVPAVLVLASVVLALVLVEVEPLIRRDLAADWPRLFGAGAEGSRGMLSSTDVRCPDLAALKLPPGLPHGQP